MATYANLWGPTEFQYPIGEARALPITILRAVDRSLAPLYTDRFRTSNVPNPKETDSFGNFSFWTDPGEYILVPAGSPEFLITVPLHPLEPLSGGGGTGTSYSHTQGVAINTWDINHNLGYIPAGILVFESTGDQLMFYEIVTNTEVHTVLGFGAATAGNAIVG